jgi:hypothetical protein
MRMAEVLAPSLESLRVRANLLTQGGQRVAEAVRIEIGQPCSLKGFLEYPADSGGILPMLAIQAAVFKMPALTQGNFGCWEERVVWSPKSFTERPDPVLNDQLDVGADWEECWSDRLGIFGSTSRAS